MAFALLFEGVEWTFRDSGGFCFLFFFIIFIFYFFFLGGGG